MYPYVYQKWKDDKLPIKKKLIKTIKNEAIFQRANDLPYNSLLTRKYK